MFDIIDGIAANAREVAGLRERASGLTPDEWTRPVLPGWTVQDMLDHVARALAQQAEAFERGRRGQLEPPAFPTPQPTSPGGVLERLDDGAKAIRRALENLAPESLAAPTPMPFGVVPTVVALQIAVIEYAMHRWDLERACGNPCYDLADDVAAASMAMVPGLLPMLASRSDHQPEAPLAFQLASPLGAPIVGYDGRCWAPLDSTDLPTTVITGSASDITMFYVGRLRADSLGITISGSYSAAALFKTYFPGP